MSHSENKVNWCLKKAKEQIEEGKKHRGLLKVEEDLEEAKKHIAKAEHNLNAITYFEEGNFSDWSMSAGFYCVYHCFLAIVSKFGYESRNQECTVALIRYPKEQGKVEFDERFIVALESFDEKERHEVSTIEKRESFTYGTTISADNKDFDILTELCKECLNRTKEIIFER